MKACIRGAAVVVTAISTAVALTACGHDAGSGSGGGNNLTIGVLLPDAATTRWETQDTPLLTKKIKELCHDCTVEHVNAKGDVATQQEQMDSMITRGVDAIVLVDRRRQIARRRGQRRPIAVRPFPVIAYDRLSEGPISG
jgi:ABC-type xylose transport system, periplasmic component